MARRSRLPLLRFAPGLTLGLLSATLDLPLARLGDDGGLARSAARRRSSAASVCSRPAAPLTPDSTWPNAPFSFVADGLLQVVAQALPLTFPPSPCTVVACVPTRHDSSLTFVAHARSWSLDAHSIGTCTWPPPLSSASILPGYGPPAMGTAPHR